MLSREQAWGWQEFIVMAATRYCLGRQTYIVGDAVDWLVKCWLSVENFTSEEELTRFAAASADFIRLTPPKLALVSDPLLTLNELFDELVD